MSLGHKIALWIKSRLSLLFICLLHISGSFIARHIECLQRLGVNFEFIFVNDGSPDNSEAIVRELVSQSPNITLVSLSRNYGQHAGMFAGLSHAIGDFIYATDCDLEEPPENIEILYKNIKTDPTTDVFYCVLKKRSGDVFRKHRWKAVLSSFGRIFRGTNSP
jgi:putative glycosyltransferase